MCELQIYPNECSLMLPWTSAHPVNVQRHCDLLRARALEMQVQLQGRCMERRGHCKCHLQQSSLFNLLHAQLYNNDQADRCYGHRRSVSLQQHPAWTTYAWKGLVWADVSARQYQSTGLEAGTGCWPQACFLHVPVRWSCNSCAFKLTSVPQLPDAPLFSRLSCGAIKKRFSTCLHVYLWTQAYELLADRLPFQE